VKRLRQVGADVRIVGKVALTSRYGLFAIWYWLTHTRFDVVITLLFASDVIGRALTRAARVPRIISSIRARNTNYTSWQRWVVRYTMRWADAVVINSTLLRDYAIAEEGAKPDRVHIIPNGVQLEDYTAPLDQTSLRAEIGIPSEGGLVGSVGRLTHQKGFDVLLLALSLLPCRDIHLLLLGTGELKASLRAQAAMLGLQNRVHFTGYRRDVPRLLGAIDLYVHAARFEGMPNAILEAMAARCPIVASAVDGICDLIEDGVHGWLVPAENASALAEAIQVALSDPMECQRRAGAAQQRVSEQFSVDAMVMAWEKVLEGDHTL
jgi:glycosyltransferase involved in cell wall biosynthesis